MAKDIMRTIFLLIGCQFFLGLDAQVPPFHFIEYRHEDGLSSHEFFNGRVFTQDSIGYIWIGTANGLNRFDGTHFVQYLTNPTDTNSISGKGIRSLYTDHQGYIWVGTYRNGLNVIDPQTGRIRQFISNSQDEIPSGHITQIFEDKWQRLWIAHAGNGLYLYDRAKDIFQNIPLVKDENKLKANNNFHHDVTGYVFDPLDSTFIWLCTVGGLCKFNTESFDTKFYDGKPINFGGRNLHSDGNGNLWFGTWTKGLVKFEISTETFTRYLYQDAGLNPGGYVQALDITSLDNGDLFLATEHHGCMIFDPRTEEITELASAQYQKGAPKNPSGFFRDTRGNLWISSHGEGVFCLQPQRQLYDRIPLIGNIFRVLQHPESGEIYACANDRAAIYKIDKTTLEFVDIPVHVLTSKSVNGFTGISIDARGRVWFLEWKDLYLLDHSGAFATALDWPEWKAAIPEFGYYWSIAVDKEDHLWITAQARGLGELDLNSKSFNLHGFEADNPRSMHHNYSVGEAFVDSKDRVWTCSSQGFSYYSSESNDFENYTSPMLSSDGGAGFGRVCSMTEGRDGQIWIAENLNRLGKLNPEESPDQPIQINPATSHLADAEVHAMVTDAEGTLWIGSTIGLTRLDYPYNTAVHFGSSYGIGNIEDLNLSGDGNILVGQYGEVIIIDPDRLQPSDLAPIPVLTSFKVFDKPYSNVANPNFLDNVELSHRENFFSFEYTALDFYGKSESEFSYKLEGLEDNWVNAGSRRYVSYTNIGGGDYTFKVRVKNAMGQWTDEIASLTITVIPPISGRVWFWPTLVLCGMALIYLLYRFRIRQFRRAEELKTAFNKQLGEVEMKALRAQMNPHFLFNSLNAIKYYVLKKDRHMAADYLTDFARLIRLVLKNSSEKLIPLSGEMEALKLYVQIESMRFDKQFEYQFNIDQSIDQDSVQVPPLIFQPYVENAIWHGLMHKNDGRGVLKIDLVRNNGLLECRIEDNGIGRDMAAHVKSKSAEKQKSMGMKITRHRMDMNKMLNDIEFSVRIDDLYSDHANPRGTRVVITFQPRPAEAINH